MCGIAGLFIKDPAAVKDHEGLEKFLDALLCGVAERGKQASGFVAYTFSGKAIMDKDALHASKFVKDREPLPKDTKIVLAHCRYATKGTIENHINNHPVLYGSCFVTHNGSIRNDDELFEKHGFRRYGEVDTEIIPALLSATKWESPEKLVEAVRELDGSAAIAAIDPAQAPGTLLLAKTFSSPLHYHNNHKFFIWASTVKAMRDAWGTVLGTPPPDKKFKELKYNELGILTDAGFEIHQIPSKVYTTTHHSANPTMGTENGRSSGNHSPTITPGWRCNLTTVKERVEKQRESEHGIARMIPMTTRVLVGSNGTLCVPCGKKFISEDVVQTPQGAFCLDCAAQRRQLFAEEELAKARQIDVPWDKKKMENFGVWAQDDEFVHQQVLSDIAQETGIPTEALDYIIFRLSGPDVIKVTDMWKVKDQLRKRYDEERKSYWNDLDKEGDEQGIRILNRTPIHDIMGGGDQFHQERLALEAGTTRHPLVPTPQSGREPLQIVRFSNKSDEKHCACCKSKAKTLIVRTSTKEYLGYCKTHWTKCHTAGCGKKPVFATAGGNLYCHSCSRNKSPGLSLTLLAQEGYAVGIELSDALVSP